MVLLRDPGSVMESVPCVQSEWELGADCEVLDRSPRRKKGEAFLGEDCDSADCDSFCELTTCTEKLHRAVEVLASPGLCSSGPLSKHYLLQGSSKGGLGSFAEEKNLPQKFDSANSGPVGRGKGFPGTNHYMCGQVLLVLRVRGSCSSLSPPRPSPICSFPAGSRTTGLCQLPLAA